MADNNSINWEEHGLMSDSELDEIDENFRRVEHEGVANILKYFDRIHDKLFTFNNILIAGYFALSQFFDSISIYGIIIPLINLGFLLFIEYRMMEKSRFESGVRKKNSDQIKKHGISIDKTNQYSLYTIISTLIVLVIFIVKLFGIEKTEHVNEKLENVKEYANLKIDTLQDQLVVITTDSLIQLGSPTGFINSKGDTVIPFGKYSHCWTDTLKTFAIIFDKENTKGETVAIDRNENVLYDIYFFDNWPDELSEGLFRVKRNGKTGYADKNGFIKIPCVYECAYQFENGKAKVIYHCKELKDDCGDTTSQSEEWFYIDKNGIKITTPQ